MEANGLANTQIRSKIYEIRGQKVMLDRDLAGLYQVETRILNQAVKRNSERFQDFVFQLTKEEVLYLQSQEIPANISSKSRGLPYAFNEYGVLTLSNVLSTEIAISINRKIIKIFVDLRNEIALGADISMLREKVLKIETEQEFVRSAIERVALSQKIDVRLLSEKMMHMSGKVSQMSLLLDEFQDSHLIIKRPEDGEGKG